MTFFNLVHFFRQEAGRSQSRRWLAPLVLFAVLLLPLATQGLAQGADWGQWVEPAKNSDKSIPPGVAYPGGHALCEGMEPAGKHAYWRCMAGCPGVDVINQFCWQGVSDAIYTCPDGKGFRRMEKIRYTQVHCGPKDWHATKHLADLYKETWQTKIDDPPEVTSQLPPTTDEDLPPGDSAKWDGGGPPWEPQEAEKKDEGKTDTGKTDTGKTDTPKTDTAKTDTGKTDTPKTDTDKKVTGGSGTTTPSGKKANKKEVPKQSKTVARRRTNEQYDDGPGGGLSPEAATAIGIGIGMGLGGGFGGRGHMGGGDRRMDRMDR